MNQEECQPKDGTIQWSQQQIDFLKQGLEYIKYQQVDFKKLMLVVMYSREEAWQVTFHAQTTSRYISYAQDTSTCMHYDFCNRRDKPSFHCHIVAIHQLRRTILMNMECSSIQQSRYDQVEYNRNAFRDALTVELI